MSSRAGRAVANTVYAVVCIGAALWAASYAAHAYDAASGRRWDPDRLESQTVTGRAAPEQCLSYRCLLVFQPDRGRRMSFACQPYTPVHTCFGPVRAPNSAFYESPVRITYFTVPAGVYGDRIHTAVEIVAGSEVLMAKADRLWELHREARHEDRRRGQDVLWYGFAASIGIGGLGYLLLQSRRLTAPATG